MLSSALGGIRRLPTMLSLLLRWNSWRGSGRLRTNDGKPDNAEPTRSARTPWTTSRVVGSPDPPPPFKVVRAFPNLKFEHPLLIARYPGSDRLFVGEQAGVLYSFADKPDARADLFFDLRKEIKTIHLLPEAKEVEAVYGLAFHPDFEKNRQCFVCYTLRGKNRQQPNLTDGTRVSRFTVTKTDPPRIDPASEEIVLTFLQGGHNGGDIHFGPDGMLYISTGDAANPNPPDPFNTGQDISDLLSSILRIDVDHKDEGKNYAIPKDNPFVGMKGARPEVWAYGFRNPWRMSFDRQTGELFVGDVGWELWESVHRVEKGGNYGWSAMEGPQPIKPEKVGPTPIRPALIELPHTIACSVTGGRVYRGKKFPELRGAYVFGDWETRRLWAARFEGDRTKEMPEIARPSVRIVAFGEDREGELYFLDYDGGTVHTIERNDGGARNADFPTKLSETGLFASVKDHTPAAGVIPFAVNSRQWQDGATAEHWAAFPGVSSATLYATGKPIPGMVDWHNFRMHFPKDAVLVRTLSLAGRRLETQLLHFDGVDWHAYTFAWRDDQADADLVPADGAEKEVQRSGSGEAHLAVPQPQPVHVVPQQSVGIRPGVPARAIEPAGARRAQPARRPHRGGIHPPGRQTDGKPLPPFDAASAARERKLADPADAGQPLEARARAYLHANCGHCHSDHGGGSVHLRLQFPGRGRRDEGGRRPSHPRRLRAAGRVHHQAGRPLGEHPVLPHGQVRPRSDAAHRLRTAGRSGSEAHRGLDRRHERSRGKAGPSARTAGRRTSCWPTRSPRCRLARKLGRGELKPAERDALLAAAAKLPAGPVRDLFEGYLPSDETEGAEARLESPAQDHSGPQGRRRPRREAVLVAGGQLRQLPQDRRPGHAGRAGPVDHRQAALA